MYIDTLTLEQFRGAVNLRLDFDKRLNVLVGVNGSGKSSILDATAILLSWLVNRIKSVGAAGRPISESDINNEESAADLHITCTYENTPFFWNLVKARKGHSKKDAASSLSSMSAIAKRIQDDVTEANGKYNLPLFAYYPTNRAVLDIPARIKRRHRFDLISAYDDSLTSSANFRLFFEWFRDREDLENETKLDRRNDFSDPQLTAVRQALTQFMPGFANLRVRRSPSRMEIEKDGKILTVNQLSDGEKCLMAMVGDLARRLAIANPLLANPLRGKGIVLIDEIDLHLHPTWQRLIIPKLPEVFPECQFLLSTHSPHIITHTRPENLFFLTMTEEGLTSLRPEKSYGKTVDRVLEDLMGLDATRPADVDKALKQIYVSIDNGELAGAQDFVDALERQIGDDPDLLKAKILIKRKGLIGK